MNGSRILLVEDDEDIGTELVQALTSHGHSARLAQCGGEALSAATSEPPDLVLLAALGLVVAALAAIRSARRPPLTVLREL